MLGIGAQDARRRQQYANDVENYNRAVLKMQARRATGRIQYKRQVWSNLDSTSRALSRKTQEWNTVRAEFRQKQYEIFVKTAGKTGAEAAAGMTGKTAKRIAAMRRGMAGTSQALLNSQMASTAWRIDAAKKDMWTAYKAANRRAYIKSGIGQVVDIGPAPKYRGMSFLERLAPILKVTSSHFADKYNPLGSGLLDEGDESWLPNNEDSNINSMKMHPDLSESFSPQNYQFNESGPSLGMLPKNQRVNYADSFNLTA